MGDRLINSQHNKKKWFALRLIVLVATTSIISIANAQIVHDSITRCDIPESLTVALKAITISSTERSYSNEDRQVIAEQALRLRAAYPDDIDVQETSMRTLRAAGIETLQSQQAMLESRLKLMSNDINTIYLLATISGQSADTISMLKRALVLQSASAAIRNALLNQYLTKQNIDKGDIREMFISIVNMCPSRTSIYHLLLRSKDKQLIADVLPKLEKVLRPTIRRSIHQNDCSAFSALWDLQFREADIKEYETIRDGVRKDIATILDSGAVANTYTCLNTLRGGYDLVGDDAAKSVATNKMMATFPSAPMVIAMWYQQLTISIPYPAASIDKRQMERYYQLQYNELIERLKSAPSSPLLIRETFFAALQNPALSDAELVSIATVFLVNKTALELAGVGPPSDHLHLAEAYLSRNIHLDQIPILVAQAEIAGLNRLAKAANRDSVYRTKLQHNNMTDRFLSGALLAEYEARKKNPNGIRSAITRMESVQLELHSEKPALHPRSMVERDGAILQLWHAELLRVEQKDALAAYKLALVLNAAHNTSGSDKARNLTIAYWKELGRDMLDFEAWASNENEQTITAAAISDSTTTKATIVSTKPKSIATTLTKTQQISTWPNPKKPLPIFSMQDTTGKTWSLQSVQGKKFLINFWATWCSPCLRELPHIQKVHAALADRSDIIILTVNADTNPGLIAPFMRKNGYTFTVLPAKSTKETPFGNLSSIPKTWLVNEHNIVVGEKMGFGFEGEAFERYVMHYLHPEKRIEK
jgi:thiol-disulfide isomerase/thioredoxin